MLSMVMGRWSVRRESQLLKAIARMRCTPSSNVTCCRLVQFWKALSQMTLTCEGMRTSLRLKQ